MEHMGHGMPLCWVEFSSCLWTLCASETPSGRLTAYQNVRMLLPAERLTAYQSVCMPLPAESQAASPCWTASYMLQ
eukprot:1159881-Pelagomonas_calceolata.AAC.2